MQNDFQNLDALAPRRKGVSEFVKQNRSKKTSAETNAKTSRAAKLSINFSGRLIAINPESKTSTTNQR